MESKTIRVLLVEDEESHAELMSRALESRQPQIDLTVAGSLRQARSLLATDPPDVVIVDSLLPDGRGVELLTAIGPERRFPVVMVTSHADEKMKQEAVQAGVTRYVLKSADVLLGIAEVVETVVEEWRSLSAE